MGLGGAVKTHAQEIYAVVDNDNATLTIYYDTQRESRGGVTDWTIKSGGNYNTKVTKAVIDESMKKAKPTTMANWFGYYEALQTIEHLDYLNTENVTDMSRMFYSCVILTSLDLSKFNTANVTSKEGMFNKCREDSRSSRPSLDNFFFATCI